MILFETTNSVLEVLFDIVLAFYILEVAVVYSLLSFITGCFIAWFRVSELQPIYNLTQPQAELVGLPFWILGFVLWARFAIVSCHLPFDPPNSTRLRDNR